MLYSLAIIDDELAIRRGLSKHIDWKSMGFYVAASFEDGEDALDYLTGNHLDVVLTDIRMSVISGLNLAQTIRDRGISTEVVLLTGYKDFEYARQAMKAGVNYYLLKPTQPEELRQVFGNVYEKLSLQKNTTGRTTIRRLLCDTRRRLLMRLVDGLIGSEDDLGMEWRRAGLPPIRENTRISYALLRIPGVFKVLGPPSVSSAEYELNNGFDLLCIDEKSRKTIALGEPPANVHFLVVESSEYEKDTGGRDVNVANAQMGAMPVDDRPSFLFREMFRTRCARSRMFLQEVVYETFIHSKNELMDIAACIRVKTADEQLAERAVGSVDNLVREIFTSKKDVNESIRLLVGFIGCMTSSADGLRAARRMAINVTSRLTAERCRRLPGFEVKPPLNYESLFTCSCVDDVINWTAPAILRILTDPPAELRTEAEQTVDRACAYVETHLAEDFGLEQVAQELYVSASYLSRLFKQQSGKKLIDYVIDRRIDVARRLLKEKKGYSIAQIARSVGYHDPKYFSRVFKVRVGRTPSQYRHFLKDCR